MEQAEFCGATLFELSKRCLHKFSWAQCTGDSSFPQTALSVLCASEPINKALVAIVIHPLTRTFQPDLFSDLHTHIRKSE